MDLNHDWRALNEVLFLENRGRGTASPKVTTSSTSTLVVLEEQRRPIEAVTSAGRAVPAAIFSDIDDVTTQKSKLDAVAAAFGATETVVLSKRDLDQFVVEAAALGTNFFQQIELIRERIQSQMGKGSEGFFVSRRHFVLDFFSGPARRVLPRRFNVLVFVDERPSVSVGHQMIPFSYRAVLLSYQDGQLDQFYEPDFSSLHENRLENWHNESVAIGEYLASRYILPCYGIFMHQDAWADTIKSSGSAGPWRHFVKHVDGGRARVFPNHFIGKALLAWQRLMVYFSRL